MPTFPKFLVLFLLTAAAFPAASPSIGAGSRDGWPTTPAGRVGREWVTAFSTGEDAMRAFLRARLAPRSLEKRTMTQRVESYRGLREKYGTLTLGSVVKSRPEELTVRLLDADAALHEFVFKVSRESPHRLVSVSIREPGHFPHGGFGGH